MTGGTAPNAPEASASEAAATYAEGLAQAAIEEQAWRRRASLASNARLVAFLGILVVAWLGFGTHRIERGWIAAPIAAFVALVVAHDRLLRREERAARIRQFHEDGLARVEERWAGRGDAGERYRDPSHPYAGDLDLFGHGSLYELLATTRTAAGCDRLARWLLEADAPDAIRARQAAVRELIPRLDLRLEMALAGDVAGTSVQQAALTAWAAAPAAALPGGIAWIAAFASALSLGGLGLWIFSGAGPLPFVAALGLQGLLGLALRSRVRPVLAAAETPVQALARTASLLAVVEGEHFAAPRLAALRAELETTGHTPSAELGALRRLVDLRDARANQLFMPIAALLMWGTHVALAFERWRARCGPRLAIWVEAAGEIEALCALASHAWEHPGDPFPEIVDGDRGPVFDGRALGHPLLPRAACIRNDLALEAIAADRTPEAGERDPSARPQALVMSGSNMSGKSTMLRTVGCNAVLAFAGAPVRARSLRLSPLRIAASIRIVDSLQAGQSHFMAEIVRLRQVVEIASGEPPALFLLDEILHGTNSHDRRIGAQAVIEGLIAKGALGVVTTHDLALTQMVPESGGRLANVHFEDHLEAGRMEFDYRLRDGVVEKSNALELMRSIGLDV